MPRGDGTGPIGLGSATGRAAGYCAGYSTPGYANLAGGRGFRSGGCGGRGWRNWFRATGLPRWARTPIANPPMNEREVEDLQRQATSLENALGDVRRRIAQLESNLKGKDVG